MFLYYCIQNLKGGIQSRVYKINEDSLTHSNQFISVKVNKILRESQAQFREKVKKIEAQEK